MPHNIHAAYDLHSLFYDIVLFSQDSCIFISFFFVVVLQLGEEVACCSLSHPWSAVRF